MFEFAVRLSDHVSSAANASANATKRLCTAMSELVIAETTATTTAEELAAAHIEMAAASQEAAAAAGESGMAPALESMINPAALATVAVVALTAAASGLAAVLYEGAKASIEASESHRKMLASLSGLAGSAAAGAKTLATIRDLESVVPQNEAQLSDWAKTLMAAGTTDLSKLKDQLIAISSAEALIEGGSDKVKSLLAKMAEFGNTKVKAFALKSLVGTGLSQDEFLRALGMTPKAMAAAVKAGKLTGNQVADAITKALKEKGAGPLASAMDDLSTQWEKFKDNVTKLFEDVDVKPFLDQLKSLLGIFDQSTASGKAFKLLITSAFDALFKVAAKALPYIKAFLLGIAIAALKFYIALKPAATKLGELFAKKPDPNIQKVVIGIGQSMLYWASAVIKVITAIELLVAAVSTVVDWVSSAKAAGSSFVQGLISGIASGAGAVVAAVKGLASSAVGAFKAAMGIASPSRVMFEHGKANVAGGLAGGVEAGAPRVGRAMLQLTSAPPVQSPKGQGGGGNKYTITINAGAGKDGAETAKLVKAALSDLLEQYAAMQGA